MGKGSWKKKNKKQKKRDSQSAPVKKETKMDTSSDSVILLPGTAEYKSAFEKVFGKPGPPEGFDALKKHFEETTMAAKTGSIDGPPDNGGRKVRIFRDHVLDYPELWMSVLVVGPPEDTRGFGHLFSRASCRKAQSIDDADLVVFTGGPDVDPALYGETPHDSCYIDVDRDAADIGVYLACLEQGIAMSGVCRGAQFLAVMNGFGLYQDIDGHQSDHAMYDHHGKINLDRVSSKHHQCVRPGQGMELIAWSNVSSKKYLSPTKFIEAKASPLLDVEAYFLRETCCFGVQGHPEYKGYNAFAKWYLEKIYHLIYVNPDFNWENERLRMKPDLLMERQITGPTIPMPQQN